MRRYTLVRRLSLAAFVLFAAACASGATWVLANGDRINGTLLRETETAIEIDHPQLGRLTLARTAIQAATDSGAESLASTTPTAATSTTPAKAEPKSGAKTASPSTATAANKGGTKPTWTRQIEVGWVMQDGAKTARDLNVRSQVEGRWRGNSVRGTAKVTRSESDGRVTRDRDEADLRLRRDFNRRTFAQALTTYSSDDIRKIDLSLEQQLGGGYRIIDSERQKINVGIGAVLQRFERAGYEEQTALLGSAFQDYAFSWNDRLKLTQESTVQFADRAPVLARNSSSVVQLAAPRDGNYRLRFNAALQSKVTKQMSVNLRYEYDYDRSIAESELRADSRLTTSLGYSW